MADDVTIMGYSDIRSIEPIPVPITTPPISEADKEATSRALYEELLAVSHKTHQALQDSYKEIVDLEKEVQALEVEKASVLKQLSSRHRKRKYGFLG